jgi:hypothetical protein
VALVAVIGTGGHLLALPAYYWVGEGIDLGFWRVGTLGESLVTAVAGAIVPAASVPLIEAAAALWRRLAGAVPGTGDPQHARAPRARAGRSSAERGLAIHAAIWAVATPGGYFWPVWVA